MVLGALVACGPGPRNGGGADAGSGSNHPGLDAGSNSGTDGNLQNGPSLVYAHSGTTLYRIDTTTLQPVEVGDMTGLGTSSLTDLAIDKAGNMVGITLSKLFSIDSSTGSATLVKALAGAAQGETSLSFIPSDLSDPNSADILVSANDQGDVYQIDPTTGDATQLGSYGSAALGKIVSSGDLIGVRGLGIYATVNIGSAGTDYLAKIDPTTWAATPLGTGTGFSDIFGLGFWDGTIYGFVDDKANHTGTIISIDANTGAGTQLDGNTVEWFGAGVTTDAPIIE
jgi:hypothetical protein